MQILLFSSNAKYFSKVFQILFQILSNRCSYETKQVMEGKTSDPGCQAPDLYDPRSYKGQKDQDKECNVSKVDGNGGEKSTRRFKGRILCQLDCGLCLMDERLTLKQGFQQNLTASQTL